MNLSFSQHRRITVSLLTITKLSLLTGCAGMHYSRVDPGDLSGRVIVEWMEPDRFVFTPKEGNPLKFKRADGTTIQPQRMYTDGGSIPRPFRVFKSYSPWGYGPAFIVHDWLFVMQDCKVDNYEDWTVEEAALVMSEVMKTMMEKPEFDYGGKSSVYYMYLAVKTAPARSAWSDGNCEPPPSVGADTWRPDLSFEVGFD